MNNKLIRQQVATLEPHVLLGLRKAIRRAHKFAELEKLERAVKRGKELTKSLEVIIHHLLICCLSDQKPKRQKVSELKPGDHYLVKNERSFKKVFRSLKVPITKLIWERVDLRNYCRYHAKEAENVCFLTQHLGKYRVLIAKIIPGAWPELHKATLDDMACKDYRIVLPLP